MLNRSVQNQDGITKWSILANAGLLHLSEYLKDTIHIVQILNKFTSST